MERSEPTLVPEWLKGATGSITGGGTTAHHFSSSSQSDDPATALSVRNRSSGQLQLSGSSVSDYDAPRSSALTDRTSASYFRRSSSSNGGLLQEKDPSSYSRHYGSFGRNHRVYDVDRDRDLHRPDRERDWDKDLDYRERERSFLGDHRDRDRDYADASTSLLTNRAEKEALRRSQSMVSSKRSEVWPRRLGSDLGSMSNGVLSGGSLASSIHKAAFERDFPSLGAEEKQGQAMVGVPDIIGRVSSPGLGVSAQGLPIGTSSVIGGDGWTSALAEVPVIIGSNSSILPSVQQSTLASSTSMLPSLTTGLNMAETLAQAPSRARSLPQLAVETQRLEVLAIKQSRQLIPMTPSMPKNSVLSPSEKPKPKAVRTCEMSAVVKVTQQPTSQLVNSSLRGSVRSDAPKTSQPGKLLVLKAAREKNGISPTANDGASPRNSARAVNNPLCVVPSASFAPMRSPNNPKPATDRKAAVPMAAQSSSIDKRSGVSQAQNRSDFFNSLRRKTCANLPAAIAESRSPAVSSVSEKSDEQIMEAVTCADVGSQAKDDVPVSDSDLEWPAEKESGLAANGDAPCEGSEKVSSDTEKSAGSDAAAAAIVAPEEEEAAFLRSLGWEENGGEEEALTEEEISAFYKEYMKLRPWATLRKGVQQLKSPLVSESGMGSFGGASSGLSSSDSKPEAA